MAGTFHGHVDCLINCPAAVSGVAQMMFANYFQHFQNLASSSYAQLISLYTGSNATGTPAGGGGTNYHDERNPFGENAWMCWKIPSGSAPDGSLSARAYDYYVLMSWCWNNNPNTGKGSPMLFNGTTNGGVAYAVAWRDDGLSPWNGTTFSTQSNISLGYGQDTLGSSIWTAGTSSLRVFPRSNGTGGSFATNKNNLALIWDGNPSVNQNFRMHVISDRDSLFTIIDNLDNSNYDSWAMWGIYDTIAGFTTGVGGMVPMPMYAVSNHTNTYIQLSTVYGDTAGTSTTQGGVVAQPAKMTQTVRGWRNDRYNNIVFSAASSLEANPQFTSGSFDFFRVPVIMYETPDFGLVGYINSFYETMNCNTNLANATLTLAALGQTPSNNVPIWIVPWGGNSPPQSNQTRLGLFF